VNAQGASARVDAHNALEFPAVVAIIAGLCTSEPGRAAVLSLRPRLVDRVWADNEHALVEDATGFFQSGRDFGFDGAVDTVPLIEPTEKGASLSAADLRRIADTERSLRKAAIALREDQRPPGPLRGLTGQRQTTDAVVAAIDRAVEPDGRVSDAA
jgi:dsDNA-specific endonuclease/ATPase MutS2